MYVGGKEAAAREPTEPEEEMVFGGFEE
jgi:hypothetical protein